MNESLHTLMREATRLTQAGQLNEATLAIQRALSGLGGNSGVLNVKSMTADRGQSMPSPQVDNAALVLDGCVFETDSAQAFTRSAEEDFSSGSYSHAGLTRRYKLYTPPTSHRQGMALVVMLHGCTQNPDDFAAGTNMNALAREQGFFVLYPEQSKDANAQACWNWFKHNHQRRGSGEPAFIASLAQRMVLEHGLDPHRVYVAGLSAGGAMAAILATTYPDVFAAAGVHSGLPSGAAGNVAEALMLMNDGRGRSAGFGEKPSVEHTVPTIVFHGDKDKTVHPSNGERVVDVVLKSKAGNGNGESRPGAAHSSAVEQGISVGGCKYTRTIYNKSSGDPLVEHWVVHGTGHAWSGGSARGSYTDAAGPDASREMLRFFFSQPHAQKP